MNLPDDQPTIPISPPNRQTSASARDAWQPPDPGRLQEMLPQYEVIALVGLGGMGAVYKARQKSLNRLVAIKIMQPDLVDAELKFAERFKNEAQTIAQFNHPAIIHVHDYGETAEGLLYFVMEFVDGMDVAGLIENENKLPVARAVEITRTVCDALHYAHTRGVIHRDIKPANVLINKDGGVKVADFGLAKINDPSQATGLTRTNVAMGTQEFAAPEMLTPGAAVDHRADIYSLGVMLYQMLTGEVPRVMFKLPSRSRPELGARFDTLICKALETDPADRFSTVDEFKQALDAGESSDGRAKGAAPNSSGETRKPSRAIIASAATVAVAVAVAGWFLLGHKHGHASLSALEKIATNTPVLSSSTLPHNEWIKLLDTPEAVARSGIKGLELKDGWLTVTPERLYLFRLAGGNGKARDMAFRATVRPPPNGRPVAAVLHAGGDLEFFLDVHRDWLTLRRVKHLGSSKRDDTDLGKVPLDLGQAKDGALKLEVSIQGNLISVMGDGAKLIEVRDDSAAGSGDIALVAPSETEGGGKIKDIALKILGDGQNEVITENEPAPEPSVIRLWDAPDKIPQKEGANWENNSLKLVNAMLGNSEQLYLNASLSALVRMNADARAPGISLRGSRDAKGDRRYSLSLEPIRRVIQLQVFSDSGRTVLREWPYPREYGTEDWSRLELRAVGEELAASIDGEVLGTIHDNTIAQPGQAQIYAKQAGYFREIELVPLDKSGAVAGPIAMPEPRVFKLWDTQQKVPKEKAVRWENGAVVLGNETDKGMLNWAQPRSRDAIIRAEIRANPDAGNAQLRLRYHATEGPGDFYRLELKDGVVDLSVSEHGKGREIKSWPLPSAFGPDDWARLELRAVGDALTVSLDGSELDTIHDATLAGPGSVMIVANNNGWFRHVEYVPLDQPAENPDQPQWTDWQALDLKKFGWAMDGDGVTTDKPAQGFNILPPDTIDAAVRVTYTVQGSGRDSAGVSISARGLQQDPPPRYYAIDGGDAFSIVHAVPDGQGANLRDQILQRKQLPASPSRAGTHTLEFRIVGDMLAATLDGTNTLAATQSTLKQGPWALVIRKGVRVTKVEVQTPLKTSGDAPVDASTTRQPAERVVDLLAFVDVNRDAIESTWSAAPGGAIRSKREKTAGRLEIPYSPPAEYDFEMEFTVEEGESGYVMQVLAVPGHWLDWRLLPPPAFGPALDGIEPGKGPRTEGIGQLFRLKPGERHRSVVEVRTNSLRALVDGKEIARFSGDLKRLSDPVGVFKLRDTSHVGIGILDIGLLVHKAVVREISGAGEVDVGKAAASTALPFTLNNTPLADKPWLPLLVTPEAVVKAGIGGLEMKDGWITLLPQPLYLVRLAGGKQRTRDMAFRATIIPPENEWPVIAMLHAGAEPQYNLDIHRGRLTLQRISEVSSSKPVYTKVAEVPFSFPAGREATFTLEVALEGDRITAVMDGKPVIDVREPGVARSGDIILSAAEGTHGTAKVKDISFRRVSDEAVPMSAETGAIRPLFDGKSLDGWLSLNGASPPDGWRVVDGTMTGKPYTAVLTREEFGDFDLRLEWRVNPQGNGGVFYRVAEDGMVDHPLHAVEFNLMDENISAPPMKQCGSAFGVKAPSEKAAHHAGEWNTARLLVQGTKVEQWINDKLVCSYDLTDAPVREGLEQAGIGAGFAAVKKGRIALQDWQGEAFYRNVHVRELRDDDAH